MPLGDNRRPHMLMHRATTTFPYWLAVFMSLFLCNSHAQAEQCSAASNFYSAEELLKRTMLNPVSPLVFAAEATNPAAANSSMSDLAGQRVLSESQIAVTLKRSEA